MRKCVSLQVSILSLACLLASPAPAVAQSEDQLLVIDRAGLFGNRLDDVTAAAERLQSQGADVRVRTIVTYDGFGNLDQYEAELERTSPSWLGADGSRKNNLIVIIICLQDGGQTGLYYGAYWEDAIGDNWLSIQADAMNPRFREGDYAGGAISGLEEIGRLIEEGGSSSPPGSQTSGERAMLLALVLTVGTAVGLFLFMSRRKSQARRSALRQKALLAKQAAASSINELIETLQMLEIKIDVTASKVAQEDGAPLHNSLVEARRLVDRSSQAYSELSHSAGDPENPKLGEAELGAIEPEYRNILDVLRQAREAIKRIEEQRSAVQQMVDGFPGKVAEVAVAIAAAESRQEELSRAGFNTVYVTDLLAKGRDTLGMAQDLASKRRFLEGVEYVSLAGMHVQRAIQATEELPQKKQEAKSAVPALESRLTQVMGTIGEGRALFDRLSRDYAETTWVAVRGNGTEAENRVSWAQDALAAARTAIGMEQQEWHKALELVAQGNGWLTETESLMKAISELETSLTAARRDAPAEINAAQADVAKAWEYINRYDEDIRESLEDDLRTAEVMNDAAREELKLEKPDYLRVCKLAREANESADRILIQARDEREAAVRLRAKAASGIRDASAKVAMVGRFIEVRHPFVRDQAKNRMVDAREALRQAEVSTDANTQISLAARAESAADEAYSLARRDVDSGSGTSQPYSTTPGGSFPNVSIPTILFPTGWSSGGNRPWGSRPTGSSSPSSSSGSGRTTGRGGGGSSSWGSTRSSGGRSSGRGGGSTGW